MTTRQVPPFIIRLMEPDDVPAVVAIDRLSFPTPWSASSYLYELKHRPTSLYYVLLRPETMEATPPERRWHSLLRSLTGLSALENHVIGYVGFRRQEGDVHISTIAVHPDWQGKGLGELLLLTTLEQALELGAGAVTLEVRASNQVAQHLYHKYGFRFTGVHRGYYRDGEDAWLMAVEINGDAYRQRLAGLRRTLEMRIDWQQTPGAGPVGQNDRDTI